MNLSLVALNVPDGLLYAVFAITVIGVLRLRPGGQGIDDLEHTGDLSALAVTSGCPIM